VCFHPNILLETYYIRFTAKWKVIQILSQS
jgi:hypothetical protein